MIGGEALPVEIWLLPAEPLDAAVSAALDGLDLLDPDERRRADRFRRPADRATYVTAHAALRLLAGARLGTRPVDVRFAHEDCPLCGGAHGRPTLATPQCRVSTLATDARVQAAPAWPAPGPSSAPPAPAGPDPSPDAPFSFSLSRTSGLAAVALSPAVVGVDVETLDRPVELDDLTVALHPAELPVPDRRQALRRWVRKEAYLKGLGTGLGVDPATVDLSTDPSGWQVVDVAAGDDALCAVAVRSAEPITLTVRTATLTDLRIRHR